jgi:hypothetical protein
MALSKTASGGRVWLPALAAVGLEGVHIHDLRHTGNQFTANAGANPRELMARMGHDSPRAALIYMHSSDRRQRTLADAVAKAARADLPSPRRARLLSHLAREWHAVRVTRQKTRAVSGVGPLTCGNTGAPLRNRTVDLLLTMSRWTIPAA